MAFFFLRFDQEEASVEFSLWPFTVIELALDLP